MSWHQSPLCLSRVSLMGCKLHGWRDELVWWQSLAEWLCQELIIRTWSREGSSKRVERCNHLCWAAPSWCRSSRFPTTTCMWRDEQQNYDQKRNSESYRPSSLTFNLTFNQTPPYGIKNSLTNKNTGFLSSFWRLQLERATSAHNLNIHYCVN